jgi:hypothetical protein
VRPERDPRRQPGKPGEPKKGALFDEDEDDEDE